MTHLWQQEFGHPPRNTDHNREWGETMRQVGLIPSDTGGPGGKVTGDSMSHDVDPDGPFLVAFRAIPPDDLLPWRSCALHRPGTAQNKVRYTGPRCQTYLWGQPGLLIACSGGDCVRGGQLVLFESDRTIQG